MSSEKKTKKENNMNKKDKETILYYLRKIVEDYNKLDLLISEIEMTPQQTFQFHQLVNNNRTRARKVIWGVSGSSLDDTDLE